MRQSLVITEGARYFSQDDSALRLFKSNVYVTMHFMEVLEYIKEDGSNPYKEWFDSLNVQAAAKVAVAKARLELGNVSNIKWFSGIGEYRIDWGPGYRVYLLQDGKNMIVLFGGGTKKHQRKDINIAIALSKEYKYRKKQR